MSINKILSKTLIAGAIVLAGAAQAAPVVATLNPQANNGGAGVLDASVAAFQAVGFQSNLSTTLVINANSGSNVAFSETGRFDITSFVNAANVATAILPAVNLGWGVYGLLTVSGTGNWLGTQYTANSAGLNLSVSLFGHKAGGGADIALGTAAYNPASPALAFAIAFGSVANGSCAGTPGIAGCQAFTSLTAGLNFTPAAGTSGPGGFFQAPIPFNIDLSVGNAGGNTFNTGYSVSNTGVVTVITPTPGANSGTANVTFVSRVPEPSVLALSGLALLGLAFVGKRRKTAVKA